MSGSNSPEEGVFEIFTDESGDWRWHLVAPNNETMAESSEGYATQSAAEASLDRLREVSSVADVRISEEGSAVTTRTAHK